MCVYVYFTEAYLGHGREKIPRLLFRLGELLFRQGELLCRVSLL